MWVIIILRGRIILSLFIHLPYEKIQNKLPFTITGILQRLKRIILSERVMDVFRPTDIRQNENVIWRLIKTLWRLIETLYGD